MKLLVEKCLNELLVNKSKKQVAEMLSVAVGTVDRWLKNKNIPKQYYLDIISLSEDNIDYSLFSHRDKDQFYTPLETSKKCYDIFLETIKSLNIDEKNLLYIEPSAGSGSFYNILPENRKIGLDIEPNCNGILKQDFLKWIPSEEKNNFIKVVIGNPPFGLRGNLALRFINHSAKFADYVAFILPQFFESDGKGTPKNRIKDFNLIYSEKIDSEFEYPDSKKVNVNVIFQIWSKQKKQKIEAKHTCKKYVKILSLSDGGTASTTRNKNWIDKCDVYIPSTCFGEKNMILYDSFHKLPGKKGYGIVFLKDKEKLMNLFTSIPWHQIAFKSTNSALNLRTSVIENELIKYGYTDNKESE